MSARLARRRLLAALLAGAVPLARAQQAGRTHRLGFFGIGEAENFFGGRKELLEALARAGYVPGRNLEVTECYENESPEGLFACARKLAGLKVDVIVTEGTTSTLAARNATRTIPIVTTVGDPVAGGFAASLRSPGGNVTGIAQNRAECARKQVELLRLMRPKLAAIALLWEPPFPGAEILMRPVVEAARESSITVHQISRESNDLTTTLRRIRALHVDSAFFIGGIDARGLEAARTAGVAIIAQASEDVEHGALFAIQPDNTGTPAQAASIIDKILHGAKPADLPFLAATRYITTINAKTAAALGIRITPEMRIAADRIIE